MRERKSKDKLIVVTTPNSPTSAFKNCQSYGEAFKRASTALPKSPRKKAAVVKKLSDAFLPSCNATNATCELSELDKKVQSFYEVMRYLYSCQVKKTSSLLKLTVRSIDFRKGSS